MGLLFSKKNNLIQSRSNNLIQINENIEEMKNLTLKNTLKFNFDKEIHLCKVLSCYDGDTIRVAFKHHNSYIQYSIRMLGYNTPEIRTKDQNEKEKAILARDALRNKILNKYVYIEFGKFCKYGRILGTVYLNLNDIGDNNKSINKFMEQYCN